MEADSVNAFKNRVDKYWTNQDVVYDYILDLTGTGVVYLFVLNVLLFEIEAKRIHCTRNIVLD